MLAKAVELCPDDAWADEAGHAPLWEQVYHALFWFNAWLRDWSKPIEYPEFHAGLGNGSLLAEEKAFGRTWTVADRILGQVRHIQHHIGYLNAILSASRGVRVRWIGYGER